MIKEFSKGGKLTIGLDTDTKQSVITFNTKAKGSQTTTDMVGVADLLDDDGNIKTDDKTIAELVRRISVAAASNSAFTVGAGSDGKTITLEEKFDYYDATKKDETWIKDQEAFNKRVTYTTSTAAGKDGGLVLQIGDTSDDFNRLIVNVGDMHVDAMGVVDEKTGKVTGQTIAEIDIKTPEAAKEAIDVIKGAINYVSGVRGDLGAVQNRLEHTANNLSVMAENIQDAESTIRDTDIAEEMMSYTKNNIL
ncbi:MAG: hypothetical protein HFF84_15120, partial [Oscillibacter sp.]|nr:hypothetical protein [Oscillibacter sp.]